MQGQTQNKYAIFNDQFQHTVSVLRDNDAQMEVRHTKKILKTSDVYPTQWRIHQQSEACMGQVVELDCWCSCAGLTYEAGLLSSAAGWAAELGCLAELLGWTAGKLNFLKTLSCWAEL